MDEKRKFRFLVVAIALAFALLSIPYFINHINGWREGWESAQTAPIQAPAVSQQNSEPEVFEAPQFAEVDLDQGKKSRE